MPLTDTPHVQVDSQPAQPPVRCLDLDLRPDGWTDHVRLSGCTFADVIHLCARGVWKKYADVMEQDFLGKPAIEAIKDQPVHAVELKLYEDGSLNHIGLYGCTAEQAVQFCRFVIQFDALADNNWLSPDDE